MTETYFEIEEFILGKNSEGYWISLEDARNLFDESRAREMFDKVKAQGRKVRLVKVMRTAINVQIR